MGGSGATPGEVAGQDRANTPKPLAQPVALNADLNDGVREGAPREAHILPSLDVIGWIEPVTRESS